MEIKKLYPIFGLILLYFCSCVDTKIFIQKVDVEGPMVQPIVKITNNKNVGEVETSTVYPVS